MTQQSEKVVKKGAFKGLAYSSAKRYACNKGGLTLTTKNLLINCKGSWSKAFPISEIRLEAWDENLEVHDIWYGKLLFRFVVDKPKEWETAFQSVNKQLVRETMSRLHEMERKRPAELKNLFDMEPKALKKLYEDTQKERQEYERKNIRFNLDIQSRLEKVKNRELRAFIVAHSYVAWYEWTKNLLYRIYKAKFGKGPANDNELMNFLDNYPSWKALLDTPEWEIRPNQIRNCVAHERFYFDYKKAQLVFMAKKEKRVRLRDLKVKILPMSNFYATLLRSLEEKITKGEISYRSRFFSF